MSATQKEPAGARKLDVRTIPHAERHRRIFDLLDALVPGAALEITVDHDPRPLYSRLQVHYPGRFDWNYLEQGPDVWRVGIARLGEDGGCECCCGSGA